MLQTYDQTTHSSAIMPQHSPMPVPYKNYVGEAFKTFGKTPILGGHFSVSKNEKGEIDGDCIKSHLVNFATGAVIVGVFANPASSSLIGICGLGAVIAGFLVAAVNDHIYTWEMGVAGKLNREGAAPTHHSNFSTSIESTINDRPLPRKQYDRPRASIHFDTPPQIDSPTVVVSTNTKLTAIPVESKTVATDPVDCFNDDPWVSDLETLHEEAKLAAISVPEPEKLLTSAPIRVAVDPMRQAAEQLALKLLNGDNPPEPHIHNNRWGLKWSVVQMVDRYPGMNEKMWVAAFSNIAAKIPDAYVWDSDGKFLIKF